MRRAPLPPALAAVPFRVRDADLIGIPEKRLRARDLDRSIWGIRRPLPVDESLVARCTALALRLPPDALFSHATAALIHGIPIPWFLEREPGLHATMPAPARAPHAAGILGHRLTLSPRDVVVRSGLRVTSAARTWRDLATVLDLLDLVAAGDALIHRRHPLADRDELSALVATARGRGVRRLRAAAELLSDRAESPPESRLRVIIVLGGLPAPRINHVLVDAETGKDVRIDATFPELKIALEYQGDYHRSREQWRRDMTRRSRLEAQGWYVMEINADDLRDPAELVARIHAVVARRRP